MCHIFFPFRVDLFQKGFDVQESKPEVTKDASLVNNGGKNYQVYLFALTLKLPINCRLLVLLKVIFANSVDPDQEQSDLGPHCLPVCKNRCLSLQE